MYLPKPLITYFDFVSDLIYIGSYMTIVWRPQLSGYGRDSDQNIQK